MLILNTALQTNGKGLWSNTVTAVDAIEAVLAYCNDGGTFGELRVYFDTDTWNTDSQGLIYTDPLFLHELKHALILRGLSTKVDYSEQGMQGDDYVSLDVGQEFINSWTAAGYVTA
jgi:hypothetical protein